MKAFNSYLVAITGLAPAPLVNRLTTMYRHICRPIGRRSEKTWNKKERKGVTK